MKKLLLAMALLVAISTSVKGQEIFKEVNSILGKMETLKFDKSKPLQDRKIATFKYDAIYYLLYEGSKHDTFTEYDLGVQTSAMLDFVTIFVEQLSKETKKSKREVVLALFKKLSLENSLFQDQDKELVWGYVDNNDFLTQFSLDTDWTKALEAAQKIYKPAQ